MALRGRGHVRRLRPQLGSQQGPPWPMGDFSWSSRGGLISLTKTASPSLSSFPRHVSWGALLAAGLRLEHEEAAFDEDRYLGDLYPEDEDPLLAEALSFEPHWQQRLRAQHRQRQRRRQRLQQQQQQQQREEAKKKEPEEKGGAGEQKVDDGGARVPAGGDGNGADHAGCSKGQPDEGEGEEQEEKFTEAEQEQMR